MTVKYFAETEKAVKLALTVTDIDLEKTIRREVWIPKTQLSADGRPGQWITGKKVEEFYSVRRAASQILVTYEDADGERFGAAMTRRELDDAQKRQESFDRGVQKYEELLAQAKALGIKGVRRGMKAQTLRAKIAEAV